MRSAYTISFLILIITSTSLLSCSKEPATNSSSAVAESTDTVLQSISQVRFVYLDNDSLPDKMYYSTSVGYPFDTMWLYYGPDKKLTNLVTLSHYSSSDAQKSPLFCSYQNGRIVKIYQKQPAYYPYPEFFDQNYLTTLDGTGPDKIDAYDSLVYDGTGKLIRNYHFQITFYRQNYGLDSYDSLSYYTTGAYAGQLSAVYSYQPTSQPGIYSESDKVFFREYDMNKSNPLYAAFRDYGLFIFQPVLRFNYVQPIFDGSSLLDGYLSLTPHVLNKISCRYVGYSNTTWPTYTLTNEYDSQNRLIRSSYTGLNTTAISYDYGKR